MIKGMTPDSFRNRAKALLILMIPAGIWVTFNLERPSPLVRTVAVQASVHQVEDVPQAGDQSPRYRIKILLPSGDADQRVVPGPAPIVGGKVPMQEHHYENGKVRYTFDHDEWQAKGPLR